MVLVYHTPWPGGADPFYQYNPIDNMGRTDYYQVPYVPTIIFDGIETLIDYIPYQRYEDAYLARKAVATATEFEVDGSFDPAGGAVSLRLNTVVNAELPAGDYRLHVALTEDDIAWSAPNGSDLHHFVMRRMVPDYQGTPLTFTGELPQTVETQLHFDLDPLLDPDNCRLLYFLQENGGREVVQAGAVALAELIPMAVSATPASPFTLGANHPNPFNPITTIPLQIDRSLDGRLEILDIGGRRVRLLHAGTIQAGSHSFRWNGRDDSGLLLASGLYLTRFAGGGQEATQRLMLLK